MLIAWFVLVGAVLIVMALSGHLLARLPLSPAIVYLCVGAAVGPAGFDLLAIDPIYHGGLLERLTEIAVLITLFAVGLRLRIPMRWRAWAGAVRLASVGVVLTTVLIAWAGWGLLGLPPAAALLLGAVLAPTDPVLASDVQIHEPGDRDAVRLSLTAEGGMNDGTAFPAVMLALGLLAAQRGDAPAHWLWRWFTLDLLWATAAGAALGWLCGMAAGHAVTRLRRSGHALASEEFLVFGLIALVYGVALLIHAYGFLAVFAAGLGLQHVEHGLGDRADPRDDAAHPSRLSRFAAQCERLAEVAIVLVIGAALTWARWDWTMFAFAGAVLLLARPLAVLVLLRDVTRGQRRLVAWFGIRGVGSVYYLAFAAGHQLNAAWSHTLASAVIVTITLSILLHGVSATPLMAHYRRRRQRGLRDP